MFHLYVVSSKKQLYLHYFCSFFYKMEAILWLFTQLFVAQPAGMLACKNFVQARSYRHSAKKRKTSFPFALHSFFRNFADQKEEREKS